jgi:hypothetical protein
MSAREEKWIMVRIRRETHARLTQIQEQFQQTSEVPGEEISLSGVIAELVKRHEEPFFPPEGGPARATRTRTQTKFWAIRMNNSAHLDVIPVTLVREEGGRRTDDGRANSIVVDIDDEKIFPDRKSAVLECVRRCRVAAAAWNAHADALLASLVD